MRASGPGNRNAVRWPTMRLKGTGLRRWVWLLLQPALMTSAVAQPQNFDTLPGGEVRVADRRRAAADGDAHVGRADVHAHRELEQRLRLVYRPRPGRTAARRAGRDVGSLR